MVPAIQTNKWRVFWKVNDVMKSSMADIWFVYTLSSHYLWKQISIQFNIFLKKNHVSIGVSCHHTVREKLHNQIVCRSRRKLIWNACWCIPSLVCFRVFLCHQELIQYTNHVMTKKDYSAEESYGFELAIGIKQEQKSSIKFSKHKEPSEKAVKALKDKLQDKLHCSTFEKQIHHVYTFPLSRCFW